MTEVYLDQLTFDRGRSSLCHPAYHDEATKDPHWFNGLLVFEDLLSRPLSIEWERFPWVVESLEAPAVVKLS